MPLNRSYKLTIYKILTLISFIYVFKSINKYFIDQSYWKPVNNISCYYKYNDNMLKISSDGFHPKDNSIFFHETSCRGSLSSRQACAIESAARLHPNREIHILFSNSVTKSTLQKSHMVELQKFPNIYMTRINITDYVRSTGMQHVFDLIQYNSTYKVAHASDILRLITLYKYGGTYLDTDVIVVKNLDILGTDWSAGETSDMVNDAIITVTKNGIGHNIVGKIIEEIKVSYDPESWAYNGPDAVTRVVMEYCNKNTVNISTGIVCQGFKIYKTRFFYPVYFTKSKTYFEPGILKVGDEFTHHFWNKLTAEEKVKKKSPFEYLAKKYCPTVFSIYGLNI